MVPTRAPCVLQSSASTAQPQGSPCLQHTAYPFPFLSIGLPLRIRPFMIATVHLQSLLAEWRSELSRQPLALSETDACAVLGLRPAAGEAIGEEELRRAYRNLARWAKLSTSSLVTQSWGGNWGLAGSRGTMEHCVSYRKLARCVHVSWVEGDAEAPWEKLLGALDSAAYALEDALR